MASMASTDDNATVVVNDEEISASLNSISLSKQAKKNKKKKEAAKRKKQLQQQQQHQQQHQDMTISSASTSASTYFSSPSSHNITPCNSTIASKESKEDRYKREIAWCIAYLESNVTTGDNHQATNHSQILDVLRSENTSISRKRITIRSYFGDINEFMKQHSEQPKRDSTTISKVNIDEHNVKFYRKSASKISESLKQSSISSERSLFSRNSDDTNEPFTFGF